MASTWNDLPAEMKFAVVEHLDVLDAAHFSKSNREAYELSIPTLYRVRSPNTLVPCSPN